jgi:sugar (pentulose or hexulose) kinase
MLDALKSAENRDMVRAQLPPILDMNTPVGSLEKGICISCGIEPANAPLIFPVSDDQQAGLAGGGAVEAGQLAILLGNSAVVNASASAPPAGDDLDCMRLNWGPYLWMRCYTNGAQFLDRILGHNPDWEALDKAARATPSGCAGISVLPFMHPEPSLGVSVPRVEWTPVEPSDPGTRFRASLEAIAYLIAAGVEAHERNGQKITRISVSGGIAKSDLMLEILATLLNRPLERLRSFEGPALGAAAAALAGLESYRRRQAGNNDPYTVSDAVARMVRFREPTMPQPAWRESLLAGYQVFRQKAGLGN